MANYSSVLRDRLGQISDMGQEATTWEQLKAARAKRSAQSQAQIAELNQQASLYNERLKNLQGMYSGQTIRPRSATESELAALGISSPPKATKVKAKPKAKAKNLYR